MIESSANQHFRNNGLRSLRRRWVIFIILPSQAATEPVFSAHCPDKFADLTGRMGGGLLCGDESSTTRTSGRHGDASRQRWRPSPSTVPPPPFQPEHSQAHKSLSATVSFGRLTERW